MKIFQNWMGQSGGAATDKTQEEKIEETKEWIQDADAIVIGAGSGLSTAAGLTYDGPRFTKNFQDFIDRYGMKDMYSAGFYPFAGQEEKWAYWSRHICCNRYDAGAGRLYLRLHELMKNKNYFVITTNVDHQFQLAGFPEERIFATQGDYGLFQCAAACHKTLYDNEQQVKEMVRQQKNLRIPTELIPKCPLCGRDMEVNLRRDHYFVEDKAWHQAARRYEAFFDKNAEGNLLFLELGVGMNTPVIIKYPFWKMTARMKKARYICINKGEAWAPDEIAGRAVCINADIAEIVQELCMKGEPVHEKV